MIKFISERVAVKVTLYVNIVLFLVIAAGSAFMIYRQNAALEAQLFERGKLESMVGAKMTGTIIEEAIDNGVFTIREALDTAYEKIPGFDPPKFHTKYDFYLDKALLGVEDEFLKDESVVYAVAVDVNGYIPTHNTRFNQPPTGDPAKDLILNRTKRIFDDEVGLDAAQNLTQGFLQVYNRDTGEIMWDISSPIMVKGKHWGGFRIGYSLQRINAEKSRMMVSTLLTMGIIFLLSCALVLVAVQKSLRPIQELTEIAMRLAEGQLDKKISVQRKDEIGKLADVLERLRFSMKAAMDRLTRR